MEHKLLHAGRGFVSILGILTEQSCASRTRVPFPRRAALGAGPRSALATRATLPCRPLARAPWSVPLFPRSARRRQCQNPAGSARAAFAARTAVVAADSCVRHVQTPASQVTSSPKFEMQSAFEPHDLC